jgi:hypothetical protein
MGTFDSIYQQKIRQLEEENRQLRKLINEVAPPQMVPEPMEDGDPWDSELQSLPLIFPHQEWQDILRRAKERNPRPAAPRKPPLRPGDTLPGNPVPPLRPGDTLPSYDPPSLPPLRPGDTL